LIADFYDQYNITKLSNTQKIVFTHKLYEFQKFLKDKALPF
jgi:hypothetical protein